MNINDIKRKIAIEWLILLSCLIFLFVVGNVLYVHNYYQYNTQLEQYKDKQFSGKPDKPRSLEEIFEINKPSQPIEQRVLKPNYGHVLELLVLSPLLWLFINLILLTKYAIRLVFRKSNN